MLNYLVDRFDQQQIIPMQRGNQGCELSMRSNIVSTEGIEQTCRDVDDNPNMHPCSMSQHAQHIVEHSMCDGPFLESQLVAHVEPMVEDEQWSLGLAINEGYTDVKTTSRVVFLIDTCRQEVVFVDMGHPEALEPDRTILQVTIGPMEHRVFSQIKEAFLETMMHPSLGLPIDKVQVDAATTTTSKAAVLPGNNHLLEYIDRVCNMGCPLIGREAGIPRHI